MRLTAPRFLAVAFGVSLVGYVFIFAPQLPIAARPLTVSAAGQKAVLHVVPAKRAGVFPPDGKKFIGIMTSEGPYNFTALDNFTKAVSHQPEVYEFSQGWGVNKFNRNVIDKVAERGMLPMISWEPWNYHLMPEASALRGYQPAYRLSRITDGDYDSYILSWARGIKGLGYTVAIRLAQEMNGYWYPWGVANGNKPGQYIRAWRHIHDIFTRTGATNVIWVWSPNVIWDNSPELSQFYPGNDYVNWIGLSGYYGTVGITNYRSFDALFAPTIAELRAFTGKPLVITETAATNTSGLAARWITQTFHELPRHADIIGLIWYEAVRVVDWRVTSDPPAAAAFAGGFSRPLYQVSWSPGMTPLLRLPISDRGH